MENLNLLSRKKFTMDKFMSQIKIGAENEIEKVLDVRVHPAIFSKDCSNGIVSIGGKVFVNMSYVSKDGQIYSASANMEFIEKQSSLYELENIFASDLADVKSTNFSGTEAIILVEHTVSISGFFKYDIGGDFENDNSLVLNKKTIQNLKLAKCVEENFVIAEESESNIENISVLGWTADILGIETSAGVDKIIVDAKLLAKVSYKDAETLGEATKEFEFKQEISAEGVMPGMVVESNLAVMNVTVTPESNGTKTNLVFAFDIQAKVYAFEETALEIVTDMFSLSHEVQTTFDFVEARNFAGTKIFEENHLSQTNVADIENFDDIIGVFGPAFYVESVEDLGETAKIDGIVTAFALYESKGKIERLEIASDATIEIVKDKNFVLDKLLSLVSVSSSKVKAGKELEAVFKIEILAEFETLVSEKIVKSFEKKSERPISSSGVKVYIASLGDTVFDVAKAVGVKPELINEQNQADEIFDDGEKIYIYSPINLI